MSIRDKKDSCTLNTSSGGTGITANRHKAIFPTLQQPKQNSSDLLLDVYEVIAELPDDANDDLIAVPLARNKTAQSVATSPILKSAMAKRRGSNARYGMSQARRLGADAANTAIRQELRNIIQSTFIPRAYEKSGGTLNQLNNNCFYSYAGGTGSGAHLPVAKLVIEETRKVSDGVIETNLFALGGQTYLNCGQAVLKNAGAAIAEDLAFVTDPNRHPQEVRRLIVYELPQSSGDVRNQRIELVSQAIQSENFQDYFKYLIPNYTASPSPVHVQALRFATYEQLDKKTEIAPTIADSFLSEIDSLKKSANAQHTTALQKLNLDKVYYEIPRIELQNLLAMVQQRQVSPQETIDLTKQIGFLHEITVLGLTPQGTKIDLTNATKTWGLPPKSTHEVYQRIAEQVCGLDLIKKESDLVLGMLARIQKQVSRHEYELLSVLQAWSPSTAWQKAKSSLQYNSNVFKRIAHVAPQLRSAHDLLLEHVAEYDALQRAKQSVEAELEYLQRRLDQMADLLDSLIERKAGGAKHKFVIAKPLDSVFTELWKCKSETAQEHVTAILLHGIKNVTIDGLAKSLGISEARIDAVAEALIARQYAEVYPSWGGRSVVNNTHLLHVLPPIESYQLNQLKVILQQRGLDETVISLKQTWAGVCVMDIESAMLEHESEVMTQFYKAGYEQAKNDPNPELFFTKHQAPASHKQKRA